MGTVTQNQDFAVAIISIEQSKKTETAYTVCVIDKSSLCVAKQPNGTNMIYSGLNDKALANLVKTYKCSLVNFSLDKFNAVIQDKGSLSRLKTGIIVLAEIIDATSTVIGYRCLMPNSIKIANFKADELKEKCKNSEKPLLQNAMYVSATKTTRDYIKGIQHSLNQISLESLKKAYNDADDTQSATVSNVETKVYTKPLSAQQLSEQKFAQEHGVDPSLIANPDLTPKQMRLLWGCKSNGALAEYFNNPEIPLECMELYSTSVKSEKMAKRCKPLFDRPKTPKDKVQVCIESAMDDKPYEDLLDTCKTANDLRVELVKRNSDLYRDIDAKSEIEIDDELLSCIFSVMEDLYSEKAN